MTASDWTCSSNEALSITFNSSSLEKTTIHPDFTYPIYGDEETITGYKSLQLNLVYSPSMTSYFSVSYSEITDLAVDVIKPLLKNIPDCSDCLIRIIPDHRWQFYLLLRKKENSTKSGFDYDVIGYTSVYPFYHHPLMIRQRISQFIILPQFQKKGHGRNLYTFLMEMYRKDPRVVDVCVEDPNDDFQSMRDLIDLEIALRGCKVKDWTLFTKQKIKEVKSEWKFSKLQVVRVVEMYVLTLVPKWNTAERTKVRKWIKKRIYEKNKSVLADMEEFDRLKALDDAYQGIMEDYEEVIARTQ